MKADEVTLGCYPRDDVYYSWVKDGKAREGSIAISIRQPNGELEPAGEIAFGDWDVLHPEVEPGGEFLVEIRAKFDDQTYERRVSFIASGDESADVFVSAVGPGAHAEPGTGLFKKTRYSGFEFGVLVMAATTEQGTRVRGRSAPLVEHDASDGVAPDQPAS